MRKSMCIFRFAAVSDDDDNSGGGDGGGAVTMLKYLCVHRNRIHNIHIIHTL